VVDVRPSGPPQLCRRSQRHQQRRPARAQVGGGHLRWRCPPLPSAHALRERERTRRHRTEWRCRREADRRRKTRDVRGIFGKSAADGYSHAGGRRMNSMRSTFATGAWPPVALGALLVLLAACGSTTQASFNATTPAAVPIKRLADGSVDDRSMCEWRGRDDREALETAGPGSVTPNVRRVFAITGQGKDRQRTLVCREVDTNLDGTKDVVRRYGDKGESLFEEADTNFDGKIDTWLQFSKGRIAEAKLDGDFDGNPDEWKYFSGGRLSRAKRDTNGDSKADIWEMYAPDGKLERIGVDIDADERVDRWDQDTEVRRAREEKERREEEEATRKAAEKAEEERKAAEREAEEDNAKGKRRERRPASKRSQERSEKDKRD
jgi:hypothetical protein